MDPDSMKIIREKIRALSVVHDSQFGELHPAWSMNIDPKTGLGMFYFKPEFLLDRKEIHRFASVLEMHLHSLSCSLGTGT
jgi:hypothetical protein